jgi:hypothetical protein
MCHFYRHRRDFRTRKDDAHLSSVHRDCHFSDLVAIVVAMFEEVLEVTNP